MEDGVIFDIKEFAVYDGPGPRQTVFLKGCPLRCCWCHNPEGLQMAPNLMVSANGCTDCGACRAACCHEPCIACGACVPVCPLRLRSIAGERISSGELVRRLRQNSGYYASYGGGVTFSGGEPLMQPAFLAETLDQLKDLHRAIETSGYAQPDTFADIISRLELVIFDIKLVDREQHQRYTGVDNHLILQNAQTLCAGEIPFIIRIPLIPGVSDTEENYHATAKLLQGAKALQQVELLPYHKTAGAKYRMAGRTYRPLFDPERPVQAMPRIFEAYGISCEVL